MKRLKTEERDQYLLILCIIAEKYYSPSNLTIFGGPIVDRLEKLFLAWHNSDKKESLIKSIDSDFFYRVTFLNRNYGKKKIRKFLKKQKSYHPFEIKFKTFLLFSKNI
jgi:hypothetical protein